jgi:hypothetical protein
MTTYQFMTEEDRINYTCNRSTAGLVDKLASCEACLREREEALAECYRQSGADPDDNEASRLAPCAVAEVTRMRKEWDETEEQLMAAQAEIERLKDDQCQCLEMPN